MSRSSRLRCRSTPNTDSMILAWLSMTTSARCMLMAISVVVVPDGTNVTRVGFKEKFRHRVDPCRRGAAAWTRRGSGRVGHRPLPLVRCPAFRAGVVVFRHASRIGQDTQSALEPAVPVHHLFHGEGRAATENGLAQRTAQDFVDATALLCLRLLCLRLLPSLRYP